ncbi:hypothetical protein KBB68_00045 [Candidatus Babeliales bacterium]|nr:hypothetical protein [Candidatus Babeliales bacterium]
MNKFLISFLMVLGFGLSSLYAGKNRHLQVRKFTHARDYDNFRNETAKHDKKEAREQRREIYDPLAKTNTSK